MKRETSLYGIGKYSSGLATVYACPCCKFIIRVPRSQRGSAPGRGYGFRTGGAAFSKMIKHVRAEHPDQPRKEPHSTRVSQGSKT